MHVRTVLLLLVCTLLSACVSRQDGSALASNLESVDAFIKTGQPEDALVMLKKAEKSAFSAYARIGVYRRYMLLNEKAHAEKILRRALKNIPNNPELTAVYTQFLLRENRVEDALSVSKSLEGGNYGSLYAEAVLKKHEAEAGNDKNVFLRDDLVPVYLDAYTGTGDDHWLRDSALVYLAVGNYMAASALAPANVQKPESAYFWALVHYDARNYGSCLHTLSIPATGRYVPQMTALASDAYVALGDFESAEALRAPQINAWLHRIVTELPCALFVNSALWAWNHEDYKRAYDLILTAVTTYPDDIPALVTYASLAYEQTKVPEQTDLEKTLRKTALRTKRMLAYDERPKMQVADALHRISDAIEKQHAADGVADGKLLAMRAFLTFALTPDMTPKARLAYIWHELELNEIQRNLYPPLLVQLAVHELLLQGQEESARTLFENYLDARYVLTADDAEQTAATKKEVVQTDVFGGEKRVQPQVIPQEVLVAAFGDRAACHAHTLEVWEGETAAYFALVDKNVAAAKRLYEYVVYETGTDSRAEVASAANLAVICSSTGDKKRALELYGQAAGRSTDRVQKSTILYRSAVLQVAQGDERGAQVSLDYSLALNPANADARLLKRTLGL